MRCSEQGSPQAARALEATAFGKLPDAKGIQTEAHALGNVLGAWGDVGRLQVVLLDDAGAELAVLLAQRALAAP